FPEIPSKALTRSRPRIRGYARHRPRLVASRQATDGQPGINHLVSCIRVSCVRCCLAYCTLRAAMVYPPAIVDMHTNHHRCRAYQLELDRAQAYTLFVRFLEVGAIASTDMGGGHVGSFAQAIHSNAGGASVAAGRAGGAMVADPAAALAVADVVAACGRDVLAPSALASAVVCLHRRAVGDGCGCGSDGLPLAARYGRPRLRGDRAHRWPAGAFAWKDDGVVVRRGAAVGDLRTLAPATAVEAAARPAQPRYCGWRAHGLAAPHRGDRLCARGCGQRQAGSRVVRGWRARHDFARDRREGARLARCGLAAGVLGGRHTRPEPARLGSG